MHYFHENQLLSCVASSVAHNPFATDRPTHVTHTKQSRSTRLHWQQALRVAVGEASSISPCHEVHRPPVTSLSDDVPLTTTAAARDLFPLRPARGWTDGAGQSSRE